MQTSAIELFRKIMNKVKIKFLTIIAKSSVLSASLSPECASADGYSIALKIQQYISTGQQVRINSLHLKFRAGRCHIRIIKTTDRLN